MFQFARNVDANIHFEFSQGIHIMTTTLIIPGLKSSGPTHWQSWFEQHIPGTVRVMQRDWHDANLANWSSRVRRDINRTPGRLFVVAHSFGVLAAVQAANDFDGRIAGALLVAPADPDKFSVSAYLPNQPLSFPSVVVASTNDHWMTLERAAHWADVWGSDLVNLGDAGHINGESGFGPWPEGLSLLERLRRAAEFRSALTPHSATSRSLSPRRKVPGSSRTRSLSHPYHAEDRPDVRNAAALLAAAGWHVSPPASTARVVNA